MAINANYSLLYNGANEQFRIPMREYCYENAYRPALETISEINDIFRDLHSQYYHLVELNESSPLQSIIDLIRKIFDGLKKAINTAKNFIKDQVTNFVSKIFKVKIVDKDTGYSLKDKINKYYDNRNYFTHEIYSNTLKDCLTNPDDPSPDLIFKEDEYKGYFDTMIDAKNGEYSHDQVKDKVYTIEKQLSNRRTELRKALTGMVDQGEILYDFGSKTMPGFRDAIKTYYIGNKSEQKITRDIALTAINNEEKYNTIAKELKKKQSSIDKEYDNLLTRLENLKKQVNDALTKDFVPSSSSEEALMAVCRGLQSISDGIQGYITDHLLAYSVKLDAISEMKKQDKYIVSKVENIINKFVYESTSDDIDESDYCSINDSIMSGYEAELRADSIEDKMDDALDQYCENIFKLHETFESLELRNYLIETDILDEAEAKKEGFGDDKGMLDNIVGKIVEMFKKFLVSINQLGQIGDLKWFEDNEAKITATDFKFPAPTEKIPDWKDYKADLIVKELSVPPFDMGNTEIMNALADDATFEKYVFSKITPNPPKLEGASFTDRCKELYGGTKNVETAISQLQPKKDDMFKYCKDYLQGDNGGVMKSIKKDTDDLDRAKKNAQRAIKDASREADHDETDNKQNNQKQKTTKTQQTQQQQTDQNTATQNAENNSGENNGQAAQNAAAQFGFGYNIAEMLGISDRNDYLSELTTPKVEVREVNKDAVRDAGGTKDSGLKPLKEKCNRYFNMMGSLLGAKMTVSMQCYKQYKTLFKWALGNQTIDNGNNQQQANNQNNNNQDKGIADQAKEKANAGK